MGIAGESPAKGNQGEWACSCRFLEFPLRARPSLAQLSGQNLLGHSSSWSPLLHEVLRPQELHEPAQLVLWVWHHLPSPAHSVGSLPISQHSYSLIQLPGKLAADIPEGWESICQSCLLFWSRLCGPTLQRVSCQGRGHHWLCWCWPSNQHQE